MHKLMVVDDSMLIRKKIIRDNNSDKFVLVAEATNGLEAVRMFKEYRPDVVTMDLTMPHLDGIGCIEKIMEIDPDVNILVVSALSDADTGMEALEKGAKGFVNKPFTEEQIIEALDIIVNDWG
jgi:two-component system chemotaxis response regulator CheY